MNITGRRKICLVSDSKLEPEEYFLSINNESVRITAGALPGIMHGTQSLCQIIALSAEYGGLDRTIPVGTIHDKPRFSYRGIMLDSARHFQKKEVILSLLEQMSIYKFNKFHWHLTDRQSWRLPLRFMPELVNNVPHARAYSYGSYTYDDIREINDDAKSRGIDVIPGIEMPGHSCSVFFTHPEYACQLNENPYDSDYWEYCLGNPETAVFLKKVISEVRNLFPDSTILHIGGDEADISHWKKCPKCQEKMSEMKTDNPRVMESSFMAEMESYVRQLGFQAMSWGKHSDDYSLFSKDMILQNWLKQNVNEILPAGLKIVNSYHQSVYFDYPASDRDNSVADWQRACYAFDPAENVSAENEKQILGGEGCIWTEQLPQWRVLARAIPRMRALSESLWSMPNTKDFQYFLQRENLLCGSGLYRYQ